MARVLGKLTAREVAALKRPGRHSDGGGLYLRIDASGTRKSWVLMTEKGGRQREFGLGTAVGPEAVSLAQAREKAAAYRSLLAAGQDPREARKPRADGTRGPSFGQVAEEFVRDHEAAWRNSKHISQWRSTLSLQKDDQGAWLDGGYCASIRDKPIADIATEDVLAILRPIWNGKAETASRLRGRIESVLDAAKVRGLRAGPNPAAWRGHLALLLPARRKLAARGHHPAMPYRDVPSFVQRLRLTRGTGSFCLEFAILTAARSGEVRGATWAEIDLEGKVWTIPPARMKAHREHQVPLSPRAIEILRLVAQLRRPEDGDDALVFPGMKSGVPLSDMTLGATLRRLGADAFTVHGFRSSFRDWVSEETAFPREVAEMALAHAVENKVEAAYRRGNLFEKRRELMTAWAKHLEGEQPPSKTSS